MAILATIPRAVRLPLAAANEALKTCGSAANEAARKVSAAGKPTKPRHRPRTGAIALEASFVHVDLSPLDFGAYRFEGREPLGALTSRMMTVSAYDGETMIAERRIPMLHDNTEGLHDDDLADLRRSALAMRDELYNFALHSGRPVVSMARARSRRHRTLQSAVRR